MTTTELEPRALDLLPTATATPDRPEAGPSAPMGRDEVAAALAAAAATVAPVWPLERFVAVNPYLGLADRSFAEAAAVLEATAGARSTWSADAYLAAVEDGRIATADLQAALHASGHPSERGDVDALLHRLRRHAAAEADASGRAPSRPTARSVADVAGEVTGHDWARLAADRVSTWAAAHFDTGQALWRSSDASAAPFPAWRADAALDRTPEIMGVADFRSTVRGLPDDPVDAASAALHELGVPRSAVALYLQRLLRRQGGWAAHAAQRAWEARLAGARDDAPEQLLAVLLAWELALHRGVRHPGLAPAWAAACEQLADLGEHPPASQALADRLVAQAAADHAAERHLLARLDPASVPSGAALPPRPRAQVVCCIDVRSEVLRRHLEAVAPDVETLGFAGFFGVPVHVTPLGHDAATPHSPVLLRPGHTVAETVDDPALDHQAAEARRSAHVAKEAWTSFKMGAITCFSFVGPVGLAYLPKLLRDATGRTRPVPPPATEGLPRWARPHRRVAVGATPSAPHAGIPTEERAGLARGALVGMGLTDGFARVVALVGHGATSANNPYEGGLACGACGGQSGEVSARVTAALLNDPDVRAELAAGGIAVPDDTWFVPALHDTTTDRIELLDHDLLPASHHGDLEALDADLHEAGDRTALERAGRLGVAPGPRALPSVRHRATDWAQVRPEWGLAGCRAFIAAPRHRTREVDLAGQAFLHSYDWRRDEGFATLELVLTAPAVVASWISLQYYASTVDNELFGSGNKVLHNVVGRLGVLEGAGGDLRVGLPWQSVHDGHGPQHDALRLAVVIEAPTDAIDGVLAAHDDVRALFDGGWLRLLAMGDDGQVRHRYAGDLTWEPLRP